METAVALCRLGQFIGALVLGGGAAFFLYGQDRGPPLRWRDPLFRAAALVGAVATLAWLMAQAALFADAPAAAFDPVAVWSVASETGFGRAASLRLVLFGLALVAMVLRRPSLIGAASAGLAATASFAWTGHGAMEDGLAGVVHLSADVLHLLAAALWIGALVVLTLLGASRSDRALTLGMRRFSGVGPAVVAALVASGLINSLYLVGLDQLPTLASTAYGRLLIVKLLLFVIMLALAAVNRLVITPRLAAGQAPARAATLSLFVETLLALAVLAVVAWLGALAPPAHS